MKIEIKILKELWKELRVFLFCALIVLTVGLCCAHWLGIQFGEWLYDTYK
ncbi:unnamed protein product [marine sediment metagenome]|uniref:Uncharacterized protein n=1 Tax=marine sediment metagenome TaxID=412755 RepID=X0T826_9ZZZZ